MSQAIQVPPHDEYNQKLVANVHPADWSNPAPADHYNLVVIGAGTAGLVSAAAGAGLGGKVALIEKELMGGDCLNVGCVPSKALIAAARAAAAVRDAATFGVVVDGWRVDFPLVMERMRRLRAEISPHDSAERFRDLGADIFFGDAKFTGDDSVEVGGRTLRFARAIIATGTRPMKLPIPGLEEAGYLTNETVFTLTELPARLAVIGAGPIGCEMAQAFARFGCKVTLLDIVPQILPREDRDAANIVEKALRHDGIELCLGGKTNKVEQRGEEKILHIEQDGQQREVAIDAILIGAGRVPNVQGMNLEGAGVQFDEKKGVEVDDKLRTTNSRIYAAGDICSPYKFTHTADALARIAVQNALFPISAKASALTIPWCTYTEPEIAHVGLYAKEAEDKGYSVETYTQEMDHVDRAILDGDTEGFVRIHTKKGTGKILGATIVSPHAGNMISEIALAITGNCGLKTLSKTIHPYPTHAEAIKKIGDTYMRGRLTPFVAGMLKKWLKWRR